MFIAKRDGSCQKNCVDYRALKAINTLSKYPLICTMHLFDQLIVRKCSRSLMPTLTNQNCLRKLDIKKIAFSTRYGHYEYSLFLD
jgi:hypothetical protein